MSRPLSELETRASPVLTLRGEFRKKMVEIARIKSPSAAYHLSKVTAEYHGLLKEEAESVAKAVRWLAITRRDYGTDEFNRITAV